MDKDEVIQTLQKQLQKANENIARLTAEKESAQRWASVWEKDNEALRSDLRGHRDDYQALHRTLEARRGLTTRPGVKIEKVC